MQIGIGLGIPATHGNIAGFTPLELSPVLWLDASDTSTITEVGGAVSQWDDLSGNGNDVVQATAASQPTSGTRTLNGLNVIDFDGTADFMRTATAANIAQPYTTFIVLDFDAINPANITWIFDSNGATNRHYFATVNDAGPDIRVGGNSLGMIDNTGLLPLGASIARIVGNGSSSSIHLDGVLKISGNIGTNSWDLISVGVSNTDIYDFNGAIAELIIVNATLTAGEITATESYLAQKWGITI